MLKLTHPASISAYVPTAFSETVREVVTSDRVWKHFDCNENLLCSFVGRRFLCIGEKQWVSVPLLSFSSFPSRKGDSGHWVMHRAGCFGVVCQAFSHGPCSYDVKSTGSYTNCAPQDNPPPMQPLLSITLAGLLLRAMIGACGSSKPNVYRS